MEGVPIYKGEVPPNGKLIRYPTSHFNAGRELTRFLRTTVRHWDLWPLVGLMGGFLTGTAFICTYNMTKYEIWLDRTKALPPYDWSRFRDKYLNSTTRLYGRELMYKNFEATRGPIESLEDELVELRQKYLAEHKEEVKH